MEAIPRSLPAHFTETILFFGCLFLIAASRVVSPTKFQQFLSVFFSNKYINWYGKELSAPYKAFHILLFFVQLISFGLFLKIGSTYFSLHTEVNEIMFIGLLTVAVLIKFLLAMLVAHVFNLQKLIHYYLFCKYSYRNFIAVALLPFTALLLYSPLYKPTVLYSALIFSGILYLSSWALILKNYREVLFTKSFYFILYFCTLEIAPYLLALHWLLKG